MSQKKTAASESSKNDTPPECGTDRKAEIVIVGAGLIGSALAMCLAEKGVSGIRVIDIDLEGVLSSSELNAGAVRANWVQKVNILCSKISIEYFAKVREEVGFIDCGYHWLHPPERVSPAEKSAATQRDCGWEVEVWSPDEIRKKIPFLDKLDGVGACFYTPQDGLINPNLLKKHFRNRARDLGVQFDNGVRLRASEVSGPGLKLSCEFWKNPLPLNERTKLLTTEEVSESADTIYYECDRVINCAGAWAPEVARALNYTCPSQPVRRQVSVFDSRDVDLSPYGMIVDTSGVYFHPEASNGLAGYADPSEPAGKNFTYDGEEFFNEKIWMPLYERSTHFERLKHLTGWAGLYEVSPDHSGIVGRVNDRVFEAHSFSGHGVMHCYGVGLALAELLVDGKYLAIDLGSLAGERFGKGELIEEKLVI